MDSRRQPSSSATCQSSVGHAHNETRRPHDIHTGTKTSSHQLSKSTVSRTSHQNETYPNVNHRLIRTPSIEIVADSDLEQPRSSGLRQNVRRDNRTNNHRSLLERVSITTQSVRPGSAVNRQVTQCCREPGDERLADKYNELRSLLLNKFNLQTLTPQVQLCSLLFVRLFTL